MTSFSEATDLALKKEREETAAEDLRQHDALTAVQTQLLEATQADATEDAAYESKISDLNKQVKDLKSQILGSTHQTLIGCSQPDKVWGHKPQAVRMFFPEGSTPTAVKLDLIPLGAMLILSRKTRGDWFWQLLDWIRQNRPDLILVVTVGIHEPEDDIERGELTLAQWRQWCVDDDVEVNKRGYISSQVLMGYTVKHRDWASFIVDSVDQIWFDVYMPAAGAIPKVYQPAEEWLKPYFDVQAQLNKPMGFAEFAFRPKAEDAANPDDPDYLAYMTANREYCRSQANLVAACWYNAPKAPAEFTTQARANAWLL